MMSRQVLDASSNTFWVLWVPSLDLRVKTDTSENMAENVGEFKQNLPCTAVCL